MRHFQVYILEGLKRAKIKPFNYFKLSAIHQEKDENPSTLLDYLQKISVKHMSTAPDLIEGQIILKDKCITQSATDIKKSTKDKFCSR